MQIKEINTTDANIKKYFAQTNVIKSTPSTLNYGKIRIMTDMDPDGSDIQCLLIQFFAKWPDLFQQGRVTRLLTPLFVAKKPKHKTRYFYSFDDYEKHKTELKGYEVDYIKGLGSLTPEDYKETVFDNPKEVTINLDDAYKTSLKKAFGDDANLRKIWLTGIQENDRTN